MRMLMYGLVLLAGLAGPVQTGATAEMYKTIGRPFEVGLVSAAGTVAVTLSAVLLSGRFGFGGRAGGAPWWAWVSGVFGAVGIIAQPVVGGKIGAGASIGLMVTAGTIASIVIDHRGWLLFERRRATAWRIAGGALMIAGVGLVASF